MSRRLDGTGLTAATGVGPAWWLDGSDPADLPTRPDPETIDPSTERDRFGAAREAVRAALERERERTAREVGGEEAAVFDAHVEFLTDPAIESAVDGSIEAGHPAPHAVRDAFAGHIETFEAMEGRMAERADDLRDVRDRLLRVLLDTGGEAIDLGSLPNGTVLLAERLTPSDTAELDSDAVAGIATVAGGRTSHAAIIARSLSIPAVVGVGSDLNDVADGTDVLVDGEAGTVVAEPDEALRAAVGGDESVAVSKRVSTTDGQAIEVAANVGSGTELDAASDRGADGIGLFRSEFLFLDRDSPPDEQEQYEAVTAALSIFPEDRVVVRTLDIGGDKDVPYLDLPQESNPFLGSRGIRLSLDDHADLFETQLRALLRAGGHEHGDALAVMFPMVTRIEEIESALAAVESVAADLDEAGIDHAIPELGAMIETPAAVFLADALAERLDFLSIGTNDLTQYVMAADRENDAVAEYHDPLHPAVLRAIDRTTSAARDADAWVGMCGEIAGDPAVTELLVGLGLDELSMSAVTVPAVKRAVQSTDSTAARDLATAAIACETRGAVTDLLDID